MAGRIPHQRFPFQISTAGFFTSHQPPQHQHQHQHQAFQNDRTARFFEVIEQQQLQEEEDELEEPEEPEDQEDQEEQDEEDEQGPKKQRRRRKTEPSPEELLQAQVSWLESFAEFAAYKAETGNAHVSRMGHGKHLVKWVNAQRRQYRLWKTTGECELSDSQLDWLTRVGFDFRYKPPTSTATAAAAAAASSPAKKRTWEEWLVLLTEYANQHDGIADVPQTNKGLGMFVAKYRCEYKAYQKGKPSRLNTTKIAQLQDAGMIFQSQRYTPAKDWEGRLEDLRIYAQEHGTTWMALQKVKKTGDEQIDESQQELQTLAKWCDRQRQSYRAYSSGKPSSMTKERIQKLEELGFEWVLTGRKRRPRQTNTPPSERPQKRPRPSGPGTHAEKWSQKIKALTEFHNANGHCRVKVGGGGTQEYDSLGKWVEHQRRQYRLLKEGKKSSMTDERIQQLEDLGFEWEVGPTRMTNAAMDPQQQPPPPRLSKRPHTPNEEATWNQKLKLLQHFKQKFKHTRVKTTKGGEHRQLGKWVEHQRRHLRLRYEEKQSPMTDERMQKLEELGFEWNGVTKSPLQGTPANNNK